MVLRQTTRSCVVWPGPVRALQPSTSHARIGPDDLSSTSRRSHRLDTVEEGVAVMPAADNRYAAVSPYQYVHPYSRTSSHNEDPPRWTTAA